MTVERLTSALDARARVCVRVFDLQGNWPYFLAGIGGIVLLVVGLKVCDSTLYHTL